MARPGEAPDRFVGRARELADLATGLERARLVTLTGTPGTGKSRLALEHARAVEARAPETVRVVALGAVGDGRRVATAVASALAAPDVPGCSLE